MAEKQYCDKIAAIKKQQGAVETAMAKARSAAAKHRANAARECNRWVVRSGTHTQVHSASRVSPTLLHWPASDFSAREAA